MLIPPVEDGKTSFAEYHFVAPKNRPVPLSILTDSLLSAYYPSWRNILDIAGSLGGVQLLVKFFKNTAKIVHVRKSDVSDESAPALNALTYGLNTVAVETINLGGNSFLAIVRLLHWVDETIAREDAQTQVITKRGMTPQTMSEGFRGAGTALVQGFTTAIDGVTRMPISAFHNRCFLSGLATFARNVPGVVIRPVVGVGDALLKVLFSVRNTMEPEYITRELVPLTVPDATREGPNDSSDSSSSSVEPSSSLVK